MIRVGRDEMDEDFASAARRYRTQERGAMTTNPLASNLPRRIDRAWNKGF